MMIAPLRIPGVPVVGRDGRRSNVTELYRVVAGAVPRGRVVSMEVAHDDDCPCAERAPRLFAGLMDDCTCETVDITLSLVEPGEAAR
jgi:hypothetical protein